MKTKHFDGNLLRELRCYANSFIKQKRPYSYWKSIFDMAAIRILPTNTYSGTEHVALLLKDKKILKAVTLISYEQKGDK